MAVRYGVLKFMRVAKVGTIMPWAGDGNEGFALGNVPQGWILCDGKIYAASRYPLLASEIADTYGGTGFTGTFPDYDGTFRVPNMTLKMPIDLEDTYLQLTKYQYGQTDAYQKLVSATNTGTPLVGAFGLTYPIQTTISANTDIDFTVDPTLVMQGKFSNITIGSPDFNTTLYVINRKLGINHTPGHSHPGTYSRAAQQFNGPMLFEPYPIVTSGGVSGICASNQGYSECQLKDTKAPSWQNGRALLTYYGDETHEFTLPTTDRFYNFEGTTFWSNVPADAWPPTGPHPSGAASASDLSYIFTGSSYTSAFTVTTPNKAHQQPAWTGVFPKPMSVANRRNYFGPITGYDPDTSPAFTVSNVSVPALAASISLPAGTNIGSTYSSIVPFMWIYTAQNAATPCIAPGTQVLSIARTGSSDANYVYTLELSQPTLNAVALTGQTLNFKHGTFPTTLNNQTDQLDPNSSTFLGHNHGSFDVQMGKGSLAPPSVYPVNNVSLGNVSPESINDALNIIADVAMPALITTFLIKAY
jgi:microcystin-dependent protein